MSLGCLDPPIQQDATRKVALEGVDGNMRELDSIKGAAKLLIGPSCEGFF